MNSWRFYIIHNLQHIYNNLNFVYLLKFVMILGVHNGNSKIFSISNHQGKMLSYLYGIKERGTMYLRKIFNNKNCSRKRCLFHYRIKLVRTSHSSSISIYQGFTILLDRKSNQDYLRSQCIGMSLTKDFKYTFQSFYTTTFRERSLVKRPFACRMSHSILNNCH